MGKKIGLFIGIVLVVIIGISKIRNSNLNYILRVVAQRALDVGQLLFDSLMKEYFG